MTEQTKQKMSNVERARLGGIARSAKLDASARTAIASKAGSASNLARYPSATHKGNFKDDFGIDAECYVLADEHKTAVISETGMARALGFKGSTSGGRLRDFITGSRVATLVSRQLLEKLSKPLKFKGVPVAANIPPPLINGHDVTVLIDMCNLVSAAHRAGILSQRHDNVIKQTQVILNASAKAGIKNLVYALSGYDAKRDFIISEYKRFVRDEAKEYEKSFPDELYIQWYRLYELPKPERNKPWKFMHLTLDQVYKPLAKSNGKILELAQAQRAQSEERSAKLHQFLTAVGTKALHMHIGKLLGLAQVSPDKETYENHIAKFFDAKDILDV